MRIFELQNPVKEKIKTVISSYLAGLTKPQPVIYLNYEPDMGYVTDQAESDQDGSPTDIAGVIAVYGHIPAFQKGQGGLDGTQNSSSQLIIDCYGFGDSVPGSNKPAVEESQRRAEAFTTLSYKAVMDRQEIAGSETVQKSFGVSFPIPEKYPISIQKFPAEGVMETKRGISAYRLIFEFLLEEDVPTEPLGEAFAGSDELQSDTYNPGEEPEGE